MLFLLYNQSINKTQLLQTQILMPTVFRMCLYKALKLSKLKQQIQRNRIRREKTLIQPGETKEVKLILTKKMNDTSSLMINNRAEIQDSISEQSLTDKDSAAGNNAQGEDDIGLADVIITIQTGGPVFYGFITLISLIILAVGIYVIKIKTTKKSEEVYK